MSDSTDKLQSKIVETKIDETPPKDLNSVTLTVDGMTVSVPKGTNVIEAAKIVGVDISAFCYHPGLSIVAVCRQCLVTIEGNPKLQPSCQQIASDGMIVHTTDDRSSDARRQMLEFTLLNHPIDCPICDKAGECTLQALYFDDDNKPSRVDVPKVQKPKVVDLGPHIVLDAERCILCTRCIRVCDEVAGEHQLEMHYRGDHEELGTAPGAVLDNPYSINTVDVCPVGALTAKDYRFTMRAWELYYTPSICNGCTTGCNIEIQHNNGRVWRIIPRENLAVNKHWMCDEGRLTYHSLREKRLAGPVIGGLPSAWPEALEYGGKMFKAALRADRASVGVVFSKRHSNEANYVLAKLACEIWQVDRIYVAGLPSVPDRADDILRDADVNANTRGVAEILGDRGNAGPKELEEDLMNGELRALLVLGHDLELSEAALEKARDLPVLIVIADSEVGLASTATVTLPSAAWAEENATITNRDGRVQRMHAALEPNGQAMPAWEVLTKFGQITDAALTYTNARQVFREMIEAVAGFKGADWGRAVRPIQLRFATSRG